MSSHKKRKQRAGSAAARRRRVRRKEVLLKHWRPRMVELLAPIPFETQKYIAQEFTSSSVCSRRLVNYFISIRDDRPCCKEYVKCFGTKIQREMYKTQCDKCEASMPMPLDLIEFLT